VDDIPAVSFVQGLTLTIMPEGNADRKYPWASHQRRGTPMEDRWCDCV